MTQTIYEFFKEVKIIAATKSNWRVGQALFNNLHARRPDISEKIRGTLNDPFYCDSVNQDQYKRAVLFIKINWDQKIEKKR